VVTNGASSLSSSSFQVTAMLRFARGAREVPVAHHRLDAFWAAEAPSERS
jgi:hypothetical protein